MKGGWLPAEDLYVIIIFFESIVKNTLENPWNLAENSLEKNFISLLATLLENSEDLWMAWSGFHSYYLGTASTHLTTLGV